MMMRALAREAWRLQWRVLGGSALLLSGDACLNSRVNLVSTKQYLHLKRKKKKGGGGATKVCL